MKLTKLTKLIPIQEWLVVILLAISVFGFTESSPIFKTNQWDDTNVSFTMGRAWIHGIWPYKDLFEQRGPLMYIIYAAAAKISETNFLGLFIIEATLLIISFCVLVKISKMVGLNKSKFTVSFLALALFYGSNVFGFGGSPEEICFPITAIFFYNILKDFTFDKPLSIEAMLINGVIFALVFWIKFSLIGFFVGYYVAYGLFLLFKKQFRTFFSLLIYSLIGFAIPGMIIILIFYFGNSLGSMFKVYFVQNLTMYGNTISAAGKFFTIFKSMGGDLISHPFTGLLMILNLSVIGTQYRKQAHVFYIFSTMLGLQFITVYISGNTQWYYLLSLVSFVSVLFPNTFKFIITNYNFRNTKVNYFRINTMLVIVGFLLLNGGNTNLRTALFKGQQINSIAAVKFGKYMKSHHTGKHPTLIEYNGIDSGFFLHAGILPTKKYFEQTNFPIKTFPYSYKSQLNTIKHQKVQYVAIRSNADRDFRNQLLLKHPRLFTQIVWYDVSNARHSAYVPKVLMKNYKLVKTVYTSANGEQITALLFRKRRHPLKNLTSMEKMMSGD